MELSDSDFRHDTEDVVGIVLAQVSGLGTAALATLVCGAHYAGVASDFGNDLKIPYATALGPALVLFAASCVVILPGRYRHVWSEPRARRRIVFGLAQAAITAAAFASISYFLAGARVDLTTPGQSVVEWLIYGVLIGSIGQFAISLAAFALLMLGREIPELGD